MAGRDLFESYCATCHGRDGKGAGPVAGALKTPPADLTALGMEEAMIVIKNVLVATDFSEPSAVALSYGRELARSYQASLHLFHVVDDMRWRYSLDMTPELLMGVQDDLEIASRAKVNDLLSSEDRDQLHARGVVQTSPSPADAIVNHAREAGIDIIVIGTHGRGALAHMLMGSVAERVVRTAPCPVLTVRSAEREFIAPDALTTTARK